MRWVRLALYVLPLLIAFVVALVSLAMWALGADCDIIDSDQRCTGLDAAGVDVVVFGLWLTALSIPIWGVWMLTVGVQRLRGRRSSKSS